MTRNERKRAANAKRMMLEAAVSAAFQLDTQRQAAKVARREVLDDIAGKPWAPGDVKGSKMREGRVQSGKFVAARPSEPAKRTLTLNKLTGKMVERRKRYV